MSADQHPEAKVVLRGSPCVCSYTPLPPSIGKQAGTQTEDNPVRYVSFIHRDRDSGYGISFPDFPGCVAVGDTVDDAIRHGCEALAFHVEGLSDDGESIPPPRPIEAIKADPELAESRRGADFVLVPLLLDLWIGIRRDASTSPSTEGCSKPSTTKPDSAR